MMRYARYRRPIDFPTIKLKVLAPCLIFSLATSNAHSESTHASFDSLIGEWQCETEHASGDRRMRAAYRVKYLEDGEFTIEADYTMSYGTIVDQISSRMSGYFTIENNVLSTKTTASDSDLTRIKPKDSLNHEQQISAAASFDAFVVGAPTEHAEFDFIDGSRMTLISTRHGIVSKCSKPVEAAS